MSEFRYKALTNTGDVIEDVMEAPDRDTVVSRLRSLEQMPISVDVTGADPAHSPTPTRRTVTRSLPWRSNRLSPDALAIFTRQLATLLEARLLLDEALGVSVEAADSPIVSAVATNLRQRLREGASLSEAMAAHPTTFDGFYVAMVAAGEQGGDVAAGLARLAGYIERTAHLKTAIRSAMIYPMILLAAALTSVVILMTVVLPQFESLFRSASAELPLLTRAMFGAAKFMREFGIFILVALLALYLLAHRQLRELVLSRGVNRTLLRVPVLGRLIQMVEFERIFRALAMLLSGGVALADALAQSARVARNHLVVTAMDEAREAVLAGERLADALDRQTVVPRLSVHLVRVGETSGELGSMLSRLADIYAGEVETALKRLIVIVEPLMIVLIGIFVALIVLSLLSAIVGINAITF